MVEEDLGFAPAGAGEHLLLKVRKRNANTQWVARELARIAGCRPMRGGIRRTQGSARRGGAVVQVPRPRAPIDWQGLRRRTFAVLEAHAHNRKLPRGALAGNRFTVRLRPHGGSAGRAWRRARGAPGGDRAARGAELLRSAALRPRRQRTWCAPREAAADLRREERGFVLSAARSVDLQRRARRARQPGSWSELLPGDLANLDGRGSVFAVDAADETLAARAARLEIHPTGPMWGRGSRRPARGSQALETRRGRPLRA